MDIDDQKTAEIALALLSLTAYPDKPLTRAWKGIDWEVANDLHKRGWILDPVGKSKSVVFTELGLEEAARFRAKHLATNSTNSKLLIELETAMWQEQTRYNEQWFREHLHPDFVEIGRSGKVYRYRDMFPIVSHPINCTLPLPNLQVFFPSSGMALISYDSHILDKGQTLSAHRTSMWVTDGNTWLLRHHQGTPFSVKPESES